MSPFITIFQRRSLLIVIERTPSTEDVNLSFKFNGRVTMSGFIHRGTLLPFLVDYVKNLDRSLNFALVSQSSCYVNPPQIEESTCLKLSCMKGEHVSRLHAKIQIYQDVIFIACIVNPYDSLEFNSENVFGKFVAYPSLCIYFAGNFS